MKKLSKAQIKEAKRLIQKLSKNYQKSLQKQQESFSKIKPIYDEAYFKALEWMDKN
jgi:hypothetical protein